MVCLFFAEENWRGRRTWELAEQRLKANGVELDWKEFVPPPVPDDQNFALTPFLAPLFDFNPRPRGPGQTQWRDMEGHDRAANFGAVLLPMDKQGQITPDRFDGTMTDLEEAFRLLRKQTNWSSTPVYTNRAEVASGLLAILDEYRPVLDELRLASRRPHSRFNVDYNAEDPISILLPHYLVLQRVGRVLEIRSAAELALGKTEEAFEDVKLMWHLAGSIQGEPFLISVVARHSLLQRTEQIIWEGLASRNWTEPQLAELEMKFESAQVLKDLERGLKAERAAFGETAFRYVRSHKNVLRSWIASTETGNSLVYLLAGPSGWFYQEQASYHRLYDERVLAGLDAAAGRVRPQVIDENQNAFETELHHSSIWQHTGFAKIMLGEVIKSIQRAAIGQNRADETSIACALERFRLADGKYPEALEELAPKFLDKVPVDICAGQRLRYRLLPEGRFVLYGVGWNEKDDGGVGFMRKDKAEMDPNQGDWVYPPYPGK